MVLVEASDGFLAVAVSAIPLATCGCIEPPPHVMKGYRGKIHAPTINYIVAHEIAPLYSYLYRRMLYDPSTCGPQFWLTTVVAASCRLRSVTNLTLVYCSGGGSLAARSAGTLPATTNFWYPNVCAYTFE